MIFGHVRDYSPRLSLTVDSDDGVLDVEFVVDTGFEGERAVPPSVANQVALQNVKKRLAMMADGNPLLGMMLMENSRV